MKRIVWIASFPKSGNTWLRFLFANYFQAHRDQEVDINSLALGRLANARWLFDEWAAIEASNLSEQEIELCRPDVFRAVARHAQGPIFLKTHEAWHQNSAGEAVFPAAATLASILIVRDPVDISVSMAAHLNIDFDSAIALMCDSTFTLGPSESGINTRFPQVVGSWTSHARSWLDESGLPVLLVRYEDLRADTTEVFARILRAMGESPDRRRLEHAIDASRFERLQNQEIQKGFIERVSKNDLFFRGGRVGDGRRELSAGQRGVLRSAHHEMMSRLGYLD